MFNVLLKPITWDKKDLMNTDFKLVKTLWKLAAEEKSIHNMIKWCVNSWQQGSRYSIMVIWQKTKNQTMPVNIII